MASGEPSIDFESPPVAIQAALSLARRRLGMDLAFVSEVHEGRRIFTFVDTLARQIGGGLDFRLDSDGRATIDVTLRLLDT